MRTKLAPIGIVLITLAVSHPLAHADILGGGALDASYDGGALQLWLRADTGTTITDGRVTTWADQSLHGHDGTTAASSQGPELFTSDANFNNQASLSFDTPGTADYFDLPSVGFLDGLQEMTIFTVSRSDLASGSQAIFSRNHGAGGGTDDIMVEYNSDGGTDGLNVRSDDGSAINTKVAATFTDVNLTVSRLTASDLSIGVNGPLSSTVAGATAVTTDNQAAKIGQRAGNTSLLFDGQIAEVIIYDRALNEEEINSVGYYLQKRYGIAGTFDVPVIYREVFPNDAAVDRDLAETGWQIHKAAGDVAASQVLSLAGGDPTDPLPIASNPARTTVDDRGFAISLDSQTGVDYIHWTDEFTVDLASWDVKEVSWRQSNNSTADQVRLAVQLDDGQWYATDESFSNAAGHVSWEEMVVDFEAATWRLLTFTPGSALELTATSATLTGDVITAFGLYTDNLSSGRLRFDSFTIRAESIPTPAALPAGLIALAVCFGRRRRN